MIYCEKCGYKTYDGTKLLGDNWESLQSELAEAAVRRGRYLDAARIKWNIAQRCHQLGHKRERDAYLLESTVHQYRRDNRISEAELRAITSQRDVRVKCPTPGCDCMLHWEDEREKEEKWKVEHTRIAENLLKHFDYLSALIVYQKLSNCCYRQGKIADRDRILREQVEPLKWKIDNDPHVRAACARDFYEKKKRKELQDIILYGTY